MTAPNRHTAIVDRFWRDGFAVIPRVFASDEVRHWRAHALAHPSACDLLSRPALREIVYDDRILGYARAILGARPIYFGDSTVAVGTAQGSGFHKDNTDRYDGAAPDWSVERYPTIRFGIYTQRHGRLPGGIDFRRGSHMLPDPLAGAFVSPPISPGDLLVWNGRTSHSANSPKLRLANRRVEANGMLWRLLRKARADWVYAPHPEQRVALFVTYARAHPLLDRHIAYLKTRAYAVESMRSLNWPEEARALAAAHGLGLICPEPGEADGAHIDYRPVPYDLAAPAQLIL